ncbi:MarR family winged helix-turn-helix transcriptional regulator [Marisediminicola senii]|uniref:MarR family winged helix-turn-helix transcriptional regulator n=1 Tax=Marisediminicola senii TaxID=2711233 RepID=UPI0013EB58C6|nr:MarR family transcriptional regulator [Marisediminicola senii]
MTDKRIAVSAWESLFRAQVAVMRHLNTEFPSGELSFNEYDVLLNLSQHDNRLRIKDLNRYLLLTQPSVSRLIDRLTARGIVTKSIDSNDARGIIVETTQRGVDVFRRVALIHVDSIVTHVGAVLDDDELAQLSMLTDKLRQGIDA